MPRIKVQESNKKANRHDKKNSLEYKSLLRPTSLVLLP